MAVHSQSRMVVVDDRDAAITYTGDGWSSSPGQSSIFGPPYQSTLHSTAENSSLSYVFHGSSVKVYGMINVVNASAVQDPTWDCSVDGKSTGSFVPNFPITANNWILCEFPDLSDGEHELAVNVTSLGSTFWFDDIQYTPSPNAPVDSATILIDSSDGEIQFSGWQSLSGASTMAAAPGVAMKLNFTGDSITWFSCVPPQLPQSQFDLPQTQAAAVYSIDGGAEVPFHVNGSPGNATIYNEIIFTVGNLSPGGHILSVTYQGDSSTAPLILDYLVVTNTSTQSTSILSQPQPSSMSVSTKHNKIGPIIGAVIGGLIAMAMLIILGLYLRRRAKKRTRTVQLMEDDEFIQIARPTPYTVVDLSDSNLSITGTAFRQGEGTNSLGQYASSDSVSEAAETRVSQKPIERRGANMQVVDTLPVYTA